MKFLNASVFFAVMLFFLFNQVARARGVDCVVAPYEADAQLAYLTKCGLAQAVITEDSDLLAFGCQKVFGAAFPMPCKEKCVEVNVIKKINIDYLKWLK